MKRLLHLAMMLRVNKIIKMRLKLITLLMITIKRLALSMSSKRQTLLKTAALKIMCKLWNGCITTKQLAMPKPTTMAGRSSNCCMQYRIRLLTLQQAA